MILANFATKTVYQDHDRRVIFQVWDTAGDERYRSDVLLHCKGHAAIIVYDITQQDALRNTGKLFDTIRVLSGQNVFTALAGNKADLVDRRRVTYEVICVCSHMVQFMSGIKFTVLLSNLIVSHGRDTHF